MTKSATQFRLRMRVTTYWTGDIRGGEYLKFADEAGRRHLI
jgi:hypothetical protein